MVKKIYDICQFEKYINQLTEGSKTPDTGNAAIDACFTAGELAKIPKSEQTLELLLKVCEMDGMALRYAAKNLVNLKLCETAVAQNWQAMQFIPTKMFDIARKQEAANTRITRLCEMAVSRNGNAIKYIPNDFRTKGIQQLAKNSRNSFPEARKKRCERVQRPLHYLTATRILSDGSERLTAPVVAQSTKGLTYALRCVTATQLDEYLLKAELATKGTNSLPHTETNVDATEVLAGFTDETGNRSKEVYYISDIHIEHQLRKAIGRIWERTSDEKKRIGLLSSVLKRKIKTMLEGADKQALLLLGGDIADSPLLASLFYKELSGKWEGTVISVLGNHELWDGTSPGNWEDPMFRSRPVDEIMGEYERLISYSWHPETNCSSIFLENALYVRYKNALPRILPEEVILNVSTDELSGLSNAINASLKEP